MRTTILVAIVSGLLLSTAATAPVQAEPRTQSGRPAACKAPTGEPFGLGETIKLQVPDAHGNFVTVTYLCTENGWVKVARFGRGSGAFTAPSLVMSN
jgi:hypothetical protein